MADVRVTQTYRNEGTRAGSRLREQITGLGLRYGLLTPYTSFIAIDQVVRQATPTHSTRVDQAQPLPQGVGELALASGPTAEVPGTPEPETLGAIALALSMLAMLRRRARRNDPRRLSH